MTSKRMKMKSKETYKVFINLIELKWIAEEQKQIKKIITKYNDKN